VMGDWNSEARPFRREIHFSGKWVYQDSSDRS
jgi:hypothetical protein